MWSNEESRVTHLLALEGKHHIEQKIALLIVEGLLRQLPDKQAGLVRHIANDDRHAVVLAFLEQLQRLQSQRCQESVCKQIKQSAHTWSVSWTPSTWGVQGKKRDVMCLR